MKIVLRKAKPSEQKFLQDFAKDVIDKNYRDFLGDEAVDFFIGSGASDQYMQENINETIVAILEEKIVGICVCKENLLDLFMVQSGLHHNGIGSAFINKVTDELLKTYSVVRVECFENNRKANNFYLKNGWNLEKTVFDEEVEDNRLCYSKTTDLLSK